MTGDMGVGCSWGDQHPRSASVMVLADLAEVGVAPSTPALQQGCPPEATWICLPETHRANILNGLFCRVSMDE